jgi:hypothetical protein
VSEGKALIPGVEVNIGGTVYIVPPLSLGAVELFQKRLEAFSTAPDAKATAFMADVVATAMRRNYPHITKAALLGEYKLDEGGDLVEVAPAMVHDLVQLQELLAAVMDVSGLLRKEQAAEKARAGTTAP